MSESVNPRGLPPAGDVDTVNSLHLFATYPFETDETYQQGLASVLAAEECNNGSEEDRKDTLLRSRVFYFNRITSCSLTVAECAAYEALLGSNKSIQTPSTASSMEPRPLTLAELKILIEQGKTDMIPNNRQISGALNETPPSQSTAPLRKKPWEV